MQTHMLLFRSALVSSQAAGVGSLAAPPTRTRLKSLLQRFRLGDARDGEQAMRVSLDPPRGGRRRGHGDLEL